MILGNITLVFIIILIIPIVKNHILHSSIKHFVVRRTALEIICCFNLVVICIAAPQA